MTSSNEKNIKENDNSQEAAFITDIEQYRIAIICKRLKGSVSSVDIINWLHNFKSHEINEALTVLEKLEYITENELIELYEHKLDVILNKNINANVIIHPVSEYGKSGTLMTYYLKKTPSYKKHQSRITFFPHRNNFRHKIKYIYSDTILIFIDDFSGSGNQFNKYYNSYIKPLIKQCSHISALFFMTLFYLQRAKSFIENTNTEISLVGELRYPVFLTNRSVFGSRTKMLPIRKFCHFYGKNLFSTTDNETHVVRNHPLGYDNSQALIVFAYNPPNNTLPIIWSSKNWQPLFPRVPETKISTSKRIRKDLAHQIGLLRNSELSSYFRSGEKDLGWKSIKFITKTDFITYSIMSLLRQKRTLPVICQILGLTYNDYIGYVSKKNDIFSGLTSLTDHGNNLYFEIKKQLKLVKKDIQRKSYPVEIKQTKYLPKIFKGES